MAESFAVNISDLPCNSSDVLLLKYSETKEAEKHSENTRTTPVNIISYFFAYTEGVKEHIH